MADYQQRTLTSYRLPERLEPEQETVVNLITEPWSQREFILVQGVAESGKTTIALHALKHLAENHQRLLEDQKITPTLITYNEHLVNFCRQALSEFEAISPYIAEKGLLQTGKINILSFRELCLYLTDEETKEHLLSDRKCIKRVADIATKRGVTDFLPSQIYALITSFLKGRPDLRNLTYNELEAKLALETSASKRLSGNKTFIREDLMSHAGQG